ncbi:hypothetical protein [Pseudofulvimonas gallinarii]|uniref:Uncharacterized protein n=1 Tax=Pseudofulvimonas gallinarii TaxID=634155 RepID=A0A4R3LDD0_9GAMM|nr:hypothetical protein [Pseudofulvimonas gallinarii]TCS98171.1 hypothetical protein EDC25_10923 [Pseudofulvimonas gallinarii]THD13846.1 hypothetical protein B1808_06305 [Pseudofulvimonas gallinarii]
MKKRSNTPGQRAGRPAFAATALFLATAAPVQAQTIIGFEGMPTGQLMVDQTETEQGYAFTNVWGDQFDIIDENISNQLLAIGQYGAVAQGDVLVVRREDGRPFWFDRFDLRSASSYHSDSIDMVGYIADTLIFALAEVNTNTSAWLTRPSGFGAPISELHLVGATAGQMALYLDNFVFRATAGGGTITDGGARVHFSDFGVVGYAEGGFNVRLEFPAGLNHGYEVGWFLRTGPDPAQVRQPIPDSATYESDTATFTWSGDGIGGLTAQLVVVIEDTSPAQVGSSGASRWTLTLGNPDAEPRTVNLFAYTDIDADASTDNTAVLAQANERIQVTGPAHSIIDIHGIGADRYQVEAHPGLLSLLATDFLTLQNTGLPMTGDYTGALQWQDRSVPAKGTLTFEWTISATTADILFINGFEG